MTRLGLSQDATTPNGRPAATGADTTSQWVPALVFSLVVVAIGSSRVDAVLERHPYVFHVDEPFLTKTSARMIREGDSNPEFFRYPSLPIYLTAGSLLLADKVLKPGFRQDAGYPYAVAGKGAPYDRPNLFLFPRLLFAFLGIGVFACVGWLARPFVSAPMAMCLAPLFLSVSERFQYSMISYLNVDIVTAFFAAATLTVVLARWESDSLMSKAVLPGALVGLTVASKYSSGLIVVPCALAILVASSSGRWAKLAVLGASAAAVFFVCVPYSILDHKRFVADVSWEMAHYRSGHAGADGAPGWPQLVYYGRQLAHDYGLALVLFAVIGFVHALTTHARKCWVMASFPLLMLLHMITYRVHFVRTILPVFVLVSVLAAIGVAGTAQWLRVTLRGWRVRWAALLAWPLVLLPVALDAHWERAIDGNMRSDTRKVAARWLTRHATPGDVVLLPRDAHFVDPLPLPAHTAWVAPELTDLQALLNQHRGANRLIVLPTYRAGVGALKQPQVRAREQAIRARLQAVQEQSDMERVMVLDGAPLALGRRPARGTAAVRSPELTLYRLPPAPDALAP